MNELASIPADLLAASQRGGHNLPARRLDTWEPAEEPPAVLEYWRAITLHKWAILAMAVLCALISGFIVAQMPPVFRSSALLLIEGARPKALGNATEIYSNVTPDSMYFQTQSEVLRSREIAARVIRELGLLQHPRFDPRQREVSGFESWMRSNAAALAALILADPPSSMDDLSIEEEVVRQFSRSLAIEPIRLSQLIRISFESPDPALAAQIANAVGETYTRADMETRLRSTQNASQWINARLAELKQKLDQSERALQQYRERESILDSKTTVLSGAGKQLDEMIQRLGESRAKRAEIEAAYNEVRAGQATNNYLSVPAVVRNAGVQRARELEAEAERKLADVSKQYGPAHPRYVTAQNEVASARAATAAQVQTVVGSVVKEYNAAVATERSIEGAMAGAKGAIQNINRKEIQLASLEREAATNRQLYQEFLTRSRETTVALDPEQAKSRIVDQAVPGVRPVRPLKFAAVLLGALVGLVLGVLGALIVKRLNNTVKTAEDVELKLRQPLLGGIPILAGEMKASAARAVLDYPHDQYAEAIRTISTGVLLSSLDTLKKVIAVTSSVPGEGKSTFAMNLAFSQANVKKVLLIEADMRRPSFARRWKLNVSDQKGLSELAAGTATFEDCLLQVNGTELHVIMSGRIPPNPLDLLVSQRFADTLQMLREKYDLIIVDCPPVQLVSDALVVGSLSTGMIYVVKADDTPIPLAKAGLARIQGANIPFFGIVLNHHDFVKAERYYGEYSGYGKFANYGQYGKPYVPQAEGRNA